jgi:hypothetical protein
MGDFPAVFGRSTPQPSSTNDSRLSDLSDFPVSMIDLAPSPAQPISPSLDSSSRSAGVSGPSIGGPSGSSPTGLDGLIRPRSEDDFHPLASIDLSNHPGRTPEALFSIPKPTKRPRLDSTSSGAVLLSPPYSGLASAPPTLQMNQMVDLMIHLTDRVSSFQDDVGRRLAALEASQRRIEERRNGGRCDDDGGNMRVARIKELEWARERERDEARWTAYDAKMDEVVAMQAEIWRKLATLGKDRPPESSPQSRNRNREELVDGLAEQVTSQVSETVEQHLGTITRTLEEQFEAMSRRMVLHSASGAERRSGNRAGSMPVLGVPARSGSRIGAGAGSRLRLQPSAHSPAPRSAQLQSDWQSGSVAPSETGSGAGVLQNGEGGPSVSQDSISHHVRDDLAAGSVPNPYDDELHVSADASPSVSAGMSLSALRDDAGMSNHVDPKDVLPRQRQCSVDAQSSSMDEDVTGFSEVHTHPPLHSPHDVEPDVSMVAVEADGNVYLTDALEGADDESDSQPLIGRVTSVDMHSGGMQATHDTSDREEEAQNAVETVLGDVGYEYEQPDEVELGSLSVAGAEGGTEESAMCQASGYVRRGVLTAV